MFSNNYNAIHRPNGLIFLICILRRIWKIYPFADKTEVLTIYLKPNGLSLGKQLAVAAVKRFVYVCVKVHTY